MARANRHYIPGCVWHITHRCPWSESVAVGDECFIQDIQQEISGRISGRSIVSENETPSLQEPQSSYGTVLEGQNDFLSAENAYCLHLTD